MTMPGTDALESVESFRQRSRAWLADNLAMLSPDDPPFSVMTVSEELALRHRELQRRLYDGGFAGIAFPSEYGGLGLTPEHQRAFTHEARGYEMPLVFNVPTLGIIAATLLDLGTEEQKQRHLPAILRGDELWVQFLSEPSGGSDLAGAITRADRDGTSWILNGSKIWSSYAMFSDYAVCLARTNWDVPKHRGLTMFIVKIHQPGVTVEWVVQSNGGKDFCQEFFDDVLLDANSVIGTVDDGWTVTSRLLVHERASVGGASPFVSGSSQQHSDTPAQDLLALAASAGRSELPWARDLVAEAHVRHTVHSQLARRISMGIDAGALPSPAGALLRLSAAEAAVHRMTAGLEIAGSSAIAWSDGDRGAERGNEYIFRQASCLGGGSTEMQRNIISERLLGMPREPAADRDLPFRDVRHNQRRGRP